MTLLTLFYVVLIIVIIGVLLYLFNAKVTTIDPTIKIIINWFVIIVVVIFLIRFLFPGLGSVRI